VAYSYNLKGLYETPALREDSADWSPNARKVGQHHPESRANQGRTILTEFESKQVLAPMAFPRSRPSSPPMPEEAVQAAGKIGYPGGAQAVLGNHHPQDRCRRRAVEPGRRPGREKAFAPIKPR
jgi:acyl-CoA synthetase (NDP forming)